MSKYQNQEGDYL